MYNLSVRNFQSIESQDFKFKGFVCITGPSNLGKSAIRRAFLSVCYNDWDSTYQRNHWLGKDSKSTVVQFEKPEDDLKIKMVKSEYNGENQFTLTTHLGEQAFNKVGRSIPEEISSLGFNLLKTDDDSFNLQVSSQHDPMFMVSFNGPTNTKIMNKVFKVAKLELASSLVIKDQRKSKVDANKALEVYNSKYIELQDLESKVEDFESRYNRAQELFDSLESLEEYLSTHQKCESMSIEIDDALKVILGKDYILRKLKVVQGLENYLESVAMYQSTKEQEEITSSRLTSLSNELSAATKALQISEFLDSLTSYDLSVTKLKECKDRESVLAPVLDAATNAQKINSFIEALISYEDSVTSLNHLSRYDDFISRYEDNRALCNHIYHREQVEDLSERIGALSSREDNLVSLVGKLENVSQLAVYLEDLALIARYNDQEKDLDEQMGKLNEELQSMPRCKECGQLLTSDHLNKEHSDA